MECDKKAFSPLMNIALVVSGVNMLAADSKICICGSMSMMYDM